MGKRSFDELSVVATGAQDFESRFGKRRRADIGDDIPPISSWRCNLTALSQEHNLYLVAYGREIYVYVPQFPTQAISQEPLLIVPSQPTDRDLRGYLDPRNPHSINNLVVQRLGRDEVVATVRDDGDVNAVLVRHIVQAIQRRAEPDNRIGVVADEIKPIFQNNVGISAWGLAIHSQARILATSSNAHEVRVFKFGLLHDAEAEEEVGAGESNDEAPAAGLDSRREMDVTQRVLNGDANIPYISFCNTGDDPEGRWLLTTDISGYCRVMDLQSPHGMDVTSQQFRFGRSYPGTMSGFDRLNAGWAIMFLDVRSFLPENDFRAAVGLAEDANLPASRGNNVMWDLSDTVDHTPENSPAFIFSSPRQRHASVHQRRSPQHRREHPQPERASQRRSQSQSETSMPQSPDEDLQGDNVDVESIDEGPDGDPDGGVPLAENIQDQEIQMGETYIDTGMDAAVEEVVLDVLDGLDETATDSSDPESEAELYDDDGIALIGDEDDPEDEGTEDSISFNAIYGGRRIFGNAPYFLHQGGLCGDLPCPILHASVKNVYLLQPSNQRHSAGGFAPPMVGLANPLRQSIQNHYGYLNMFDRLNLNAYIPALGVLVLASQKGRAMVLSLTKLSAGSAYPAEMPEQGHKTNYAMRVERVLPLESQEKRNERPFAPLHGLAAAPIQGTAGPKRWRLMMMYQDHSVLSYELSRQSSRDSAVDISTLAI